MKTTQHAQENNSLKSFTVFEKVQFQWKTRIHWLLYIPRRYSFFKEINEHKLQEHLF